MVDNRSTDCTQDIARRFADRIETWGPERSAQRNHGLTVSTGQLILFLDSDQLLERRVVEEAVTAISQKTFLGALVVPELSFGHGFLAQCRSLEKRLYLEDSRVEAARFFTRESVTRVGGYDESLFAGEDWDLADRVQRAGYSFDRIEAHIWHDEGHIYVRQAFAKKRYYGRNLRKYYEADGNRRRPILRPALWSQPSLLARDPLHAAGLALLKLVEGAGFAAGAYLDRESYDRR